MGKNNVLTIIKKYRLLIIFSLLFLTGCGTEITPIDGSSTGIFDHYFIYPFSLLIKTLANILGSYGLSIIIITLAIRLVLLPFMMKQMKASQIGQEKMKIMKPEMEQIQEKYRSKKGTDHQLDMQKELTALYKKHQYNPFQMAAGCLPMLIQLPFLFAFYYAIRRTPEISAQSFLWFDLGQTDIILVLIAVAIYFLQAKVSLIGLPETQKKQMAILGYFSPVMIGVISLNSPAVLPLYWAVGGLFVLLQTLYMKKFLTNGVTKDPKKALQE
ncbi:membrane protein insertase YidC [Pseudogracilibacillus auburnensis]|uniref:Membrane protein insertase YidC n=1 Tax=Pseudogracilibacillus auburnensis TaxID=1494959 RepID=A0A2V3VP61_9BACI|nr:membrane protein insertase YidC [Pseudogracilibacillus auburnensis]MBO1002560.1 membrane protein insertase YidC [Pseudogracilibacillus auburnensis]PXW82598.1 YidC/Oxa1 family membrane protein insertase [Pseudogracilibacillus auburnensis]